MSEQTRSERYRAQGDHYLEMKAKMAEQRRQILENKEPDAARRAKRLESAMVSMQVAADKHFRIADELDGKEQG